MNDGWILCSRPGFRRWLDSSRSVCDRDIESGGGDQLSNENRSRPSIFSIESCSGYDNEAQKVQTIGNNDRHGTTQPSLEAIIAIISMGSTIMVGLMGLDFSQTKGDDDVRRTSLFNPHTMFYCSLVVIGMATFYIITVGTILRRLHPTFAETLNLAALVLAVLSVTLLLWAFLPRMFRWVPWIFFTATILAVLVVQFYAWAKRRRSPEKIWWSEHDDGHWCTAIYSPSVILRNSSHQILMTSPSCSSRLRRAHSSTL